MNKPSLLLATSLLAAASLPVAAHDRDEVVGLLVGATSGGAIGYHVGGRDGAAVGALLGAAVGVSIADNDRHRDHRQVRQDNYYAEPPVVYVHERRPPPRYIYVSERPRYYREEHRHQVRYHHRRHHQHDRYCDH